MRAANLAALYFGAVLASIRGIAPQDHALYTPLKGDKFQCLSNPDIVIPYSQVNDDYCDCPDGSDEPGTSACSGVLVNKDHNNITMKGFYCANKGHIPGYLPHSRVNDGNCDYDICCDGSDEYSGLIECPDRCEEIGKEYKRQQKELSEINAIGFKIRQGWVQEAAKIRAILEDERISVSNSIQSANQDVQSLEAQVEIETDKAKNREGRSKWTSPSFEKLDKRVQYLKAKIGDGQAKVDRLEQQVGEIEEILSNLKVSYNPNFNDAGVKTAIRRFDEYLSEKAPKEDDDNEKIQQGQDVDKDLLKDVAYDVADAIGQQDILSVLLPPTWNTWISQNKAKVSEWLVSNGLLAEGQGKQVETPGLVEAKRKHGEKVRLLDNLQSRLANIDRELEVIGKDDVFRALKDQCISSDLGEYTYEICWLGGATQISNKDNSRVSLGHFADIENDNVLHYKDGQRCWNGPNRDAQVTLLCGKNDTILSVHEPQRCLYKIRVLTPALCHHNPDDQSILHDEL